MSRFRFIPITVVLLMVALCMASCSSSHHVAKGSAAPSRGSNVERRQAYRHLPRDRRALIEEALEWMGTPYKYAGQTKGVETDCSGMVMQVYLSTLHIALPRNSAKQAEFCNTLKHEDVKAGDLVFFATGSDPKRVTHVGMMIDPVQFIHASSSKGVVISSMENRWYSTRLLKYGRVPQMK